MRQIYLIQFIPEKSTSTFPRHFATDTGWLADGSDHFDANLRRFACLVEDCNVNRFSLERTFSEGSAFVVPPPLLHHRRPNSICRLRGVLCCYSQMSVCRFPAEHPIVRSYSRLDLPNGGFNANRILPGWSPKRRGTFLNRGGKVLQDFSNEQILTLLSKNEC